MLKIFIASDHAGVERKSEIVQELLSKNFLSDLKREVIDLGPQSLDSVDYPDFADLVCKKIHGFSLIQGSLKDVSQKSASDLSTESSFKSFPAEIGILICGSGQGMAIRANKYPQIRAALCWTPEVARLSREHNDSNILCMGSRVIDLETALQIVQTYLTTPFAGGRHSARVAKVSTPV